MARLVDETVFGLVDEVRFETRWGENGRRSVSGNTEILCFCESEITFFKPSYILDHIVFFYQFINTHWRIDLIITKSERVFAFYE